jgi:hypothetical protein
MRTSQQSVKGSKNGASTPADSTEGSSSSTDGGANEEAEEPQASHLYVQCLHACIQCLHAWCIYTMI